MKRLIGILTAFVMMMTLTALPASADGELDITSLYKAKDVDDTWSDDAELITLLGTTAESSGNGVSVSGNTVTITREGEYVLTGTLAGQVVIEVAETEKVHLILRGAVIESPEGPAIYEKSADKLIITLAEGTENALSDSTSVQDGDDTIGAALYAEDDLSINGKGALTVKGNAGNGIHSKADLVIADGSIQVTAANDGIKGRNSVLVLAGALNIQSSGDGIVSTRDDKDGKGYVVIAGGSLTVTTGKGAGEAVQTASWGGKGGMGGMRGMRGGMWGSETTASTADTPSIKGIKAATELTVCGGTLDINAEDDALHADQITISGGTISLRTGDDGVHGDTRVSILGGSLSILQCTEGVESEKVEIAGGVTSIVASDDGVNATTSGSSTGWNREASDGSTLTVSGGELYVTAGSDALDSNGSIVISGGILGLAAATTMGEGTIDSNGSSTMSGGTLILATSGNLYGMGLVSGQTVMSLSASVSAGSEICLKDGNGNVLGSFVPQNSFSTVAVASSALASGDACEVLVGDTAVYTGALSGSTNSAGNQNNAFGGFGGGPGGSGFGGGQGGGHGGRGGW